jgi:peptidyl-prolyl cis-trans isomerase D
MAPVDPSLIDEQLAAVKADYTVADQARVSHILLIPSDDEDAAAFAQRIDDVAARLSAGEDFAAVAETASDDLGSASSGGELGFTDGSAFPEPMEAAIAVLDVGEISAPVETDAGTHFIRVDERVAGEKPDDAVLRAELEASIQRSEAERELLVAVDTLRDLSFNAASLAGPAKAIGAEVKRSQAVTQSSGEGVFENAQVRTALYAPEVLEVGNNSDVIELAGPRFVVARIAERIPPAPKAFETVAADIKTRLESEALQQRLEQLLAEVTTRRTDGEGFDAIAEEGGYEWQVVLDAKRRGGRLPQEIAETAFTMAVTEAPDLELVALPGNQYALVELSRIRPGAVLNLSDAEAKALAQQVSQLQGEVSLLEFRSALRADAMIVTR